ncbi:cytochrome b [Pedomonas mirosovicensis]|uniref:cytochrome b n=1 Tax=Pedomonas mirosovicensis TaxID=2908641 RepID=UPI002167D56B|nr:cytochrome b/b6 domain-containing protein [Pedomonas mirosovicensis]MCH8685179.1 cytochrome b/b6 domain-containing protein [Pedomonas mirosovicensis]
MLNDTPTRYGTLTRLIHWTMAALIVLQFLKLGDYINDGEHWVGQTIVPLHGSLGLLLFVLIVVRLAWAVKQRGRRPLYAGLQRILAKAGHGLLYACMVLMPLSGMSRGARPRPGPQAVRPPADRGQRHANRLAPRLQPDPRAARLAVRGAGDRPHPCRPLPSVRNQGRHLRPHGGVNPPSQSAPRQANGRS